MCVCVCVWGRGGTNGCVTMIHVAALDTATDLHPSFIQSFHLLHALFLSSVVLDSLLFYVVGDEVDTINCWFRSAICKVAVISNVSIIKVMFLLLLHGNTVSVCALEFVQLLCVFFCTVLC